MNPIFYVTQVPVTPTPVPTPKIAMETQWFVLGIGPLSDAAIITMCVICVVIFVFAAAFYGNVDLDD